MHSNIVSTRMKQNRLLISLVGAGALMALAPMAHADRGWLSDWQSLYPNSLSDDYSSCALCHTSIDTNGSLNAYGSAVRGGIGNAESADSDGEGHSNIAEITANTQPAWTGSAPSGVDGDLDPIDVVVNDPPTADPGGPYTGSAGENIFFDGRGSFDPDGTISSYSWNFGDGGTASGSTTSHAYSADGSYTVSLTVMDNDGAADTASTNATIVTIGTSIPPIADAGGDYSGTLNQQLTLNGTGSVDPDGGAIVRYDWDFGDGTSALDAGSTPNHTYTGTGNFTIILSVTDDEGDTDTDTAIATIGSGELPPIADVKGPITADIGETVTFDATGSSDPDGSIEIYDWNFGDGTSLLDGGATPMHTYSSAGTYNVTLTVYDNDGLSDSDATTANIIDPLDVPVDEVDDEDRDDYDRDDDDRDDDDRDDDDRDDDERDYDRDRD